MGLHISFKHPFGKHSLLHSAGGLAKKLAPFAGLIPGVGPLAGLAMGGLGSLAHGDSLGDAALSGGLGYLGTKVGSDLTGGKGVRDLGGAFTKLGHLAKTPGVLGNAAGTGLDFGKTASAALAGMQLYGQSKQNQKANAYNNSNIDLRNQLMSRILTQPKYNFAPNGPTSPQLAGG